MKNKKCSKCKKIKPILEFYKYKITKDGYRPDCKECTKKRSKEYREKHKEYYKEYGAEYRKKHYKPKPIKLKICKICNKEFKPNSNVQKYCSEECVKIKNKKYEKKYYHDNKEKIKRYKQKITKKLKKYNKIYRKTHRKELSEYKLKKRKEDINYKIVCNLRTRINNAIKNNYKSGKTIELLGCSIKKLKQHLEKQFKPGMSWDNYGRGWNGKKEWQVDHINPCASFDLSKPSEQKKCFHYTNLQPLWAEENFKKGGKLLCVC